MLTIGLGYMNVVKRKCVRNMKVGFVLSREYQKRG